MPIDAFICFFDSGLPGSCSTEKSAAAGVGAVIGVIPGGRVGSRVAEKALEEVAPTLIRDATGKIHGILPTVEQLKKSLSPAQIRQAADEQRWPRFFGHGYKWISARA